ncbi:MAG TPA: hypothetical protein VLT33_39585 [Labilithrix sp.]|nr:hypothetical protein [Labilithrix sp.]
MKVDRSRFLLLTTALAAASAVGVMATGCTVTSTDKGTTTPPSGVDSGGAADDGGADAYYTDGGDGGACLDDTGETPTCAAVNASCTAACQHYLPNYKKGVARSIIGCIAALPTCEGVDAQAEVSNCVQIALGKACADNTATDFCTPISESCGADAGKAALDLQVCTDVATGLNSSGRAAFTTCITEGTAGYCKLDPTSCVELIE